MSFSDRQRTAFKESKALDFDSFPDGDYQGTLETVTVKPYGEKQERKVMLEIRLFFPSAQDGMAYRQFLSLDNEASYGVLKTVLRKFGHNPEEMEIDGVARAFGTNIGHEVHFKLETTTAKNGKDYQNPRITAVVRTELKKTGAPAIEVDDDIPFSPYGF
jgi:hypothetical protein